MVPSDLVSWLTGLGYVVAGDVDLPVCAWVETVQKTRVTFNRIRGRFEHGIDLPRWRGLLARQARDGLGALAIVQAIPPVVLVGLLPDIARGAVEWRGDKPMVYWDVRNFQRWEMSETMHHERTEPVVVRPWEQVPAAEQGRLL